MIYAQNHAFVGMDNALKVEHEHTTWARNKKIIQYFPWDTGCLIGIILMVYFN